MISDGVI